jgi:diacylglycerol kinase (ATP)
MNTPLIIINPHARQGKAALLKPKIEAHLLANHWHANVVMCGTSSSLRAAFASLPKGARVIAVGGDGTNHQLLPYLLAGEHEYGLVPYGSGDDVARALGLFGLRWQEALRHALIAPPCFVDVAMAKNQLTGQVRHFLGCFLFGIDGHINNQTSAWKFKGAWPYFLTLLKELPRLRGWNLCLSWTDVDGRRHETTLMRQILCSVLNTPTYGSGYPIAPMARMNDGALMLLQAPMVGRLKFLDLFFKMLKGKHLETQHVRLDVVTQLVVRSPDLLCLSADGEVIDWVTPRVSIKVLPAALKMVVGSKFLKQ